MIDFLLVLFWLVWACEGDDRVFDRLGEVDVRFGRLDGEDDDRFIDCDGLLLLLLLL